jgi:putative ABC transport system permease protein
MFRFLSLILKNSLRNRRRSILTIGSIAISLCILGLLGGIYRALFLGEATPAQALRLVVRHRVSLTQPMPVSYRQRIERIPGVRNIVIKDWFGGTYKDNRDTRNFFARFATEPNDLFKVHPEYVIPEEQQQAFQRERTGCIVSKALADTLGFKVGDRINLLGDIYPVTLELKVVGIFDEPDHVLTLYFNREYLRESLGPNNRRRDDAGIFYVQAASAADIPRIAEAVDREFDNSPAPTKTESERAFQLSFASFLGNLKLFLMAIGAAVAFTILLVSANTISMSVRERIREVGILKTLGFTRSEILGIILSEAAVISIIGGALGCLLAQGLCVGVRNSPAAGNFAQGMANLGMTPTLAALCLVVALFIGLVSSFIPAWGAARTTILDALRYSE